MFVGHWKPIEPSSFEIRGSFLLSFYLLWFLNLYKAIACKMYGIEGYLFSNVIHMKT